MYNETNTVSHEEQELICLHRKDYYIFGNTSLFPNTKIYQFLPFKPEKKLSLELAAVLEHELIYSSENLNNNLRNLRKQSTI